MRPAASSVLSALRKYTPRTGTTSGGSSRLALSLTLVCPIVSDTPTALHRSKPAARAIPLAEHAHTPLPTPQPRRRAARTQEDTVTTRHRGSDHTPRLPGTYWATSRVCWYARCESSRRGSPAPWWASRDALNSLRAPIVVEAGEYHFRRMYL